MICLRPIVILIAYGLTITWSVTLFAGPASDCSRLLEPYVVGGEFLAQRQQGLIASPSTQKAVQNFESENQVTLDRASEKIAAWLFSLDQIIRQQTTNPQPLNQLKQQFYDLHLLRFEDIPESYFETQVRLARERGHGEIKLTQNSKKKIANTAIEDQKSSLDAWLNYLLTVESLQSYPAWVQYWSLTEIVKMGKFNSQQGTFSGRPKGTVTPFPELNREAYAMVIDLVVKHLNRDELPKNADPALLSLLKKKTFSNMYGRALVVVANQTANLSSLEGEWIRYPQGRNFKPLYESLQGKGTGWCTAGAETAKSQLKDGDFYVYYTKDSSGEYRQPRIAIRMEGSQIGEVRGIGHEQNLDSEISSSGILDKKLTEFGLEGQKYLKRSADMKLLTEIEQKFGQGVELSSAELRFLYEIDSKIEGFGYQKDPRIDEIKSKRDFRKDLGVIFKVSPDQITDQKDDILSGKAQYIYGDFTYVSSNDLYRKSRNQAGDDLSKVRLVGIIGDAHFSELRDSAPLKNLKFVTGYANFNFLRDGSGLSSLESIGEYAIFTYLADHRHLKSLQYIGGRASFSPLMQMEWVQKGSRGQFVSID
jgi:hypothetical protein